MRVGGAHGWRVVRGVGCGCGRRGGGTTARGRAVKGFVEFTASPVVFFRRMAAQDIRMLRAMVPVLVYAVFTISAPVAFGSRNVYATDTPMHNVQVLAILFSAITGTAVSCGLSIGSVLVMSLLLSGVADHRRLVECCGVAYWSQVPWSLLYLIIVWGMDAPGSDMSLAAASRYVEWLENSPLILTTRLVSAYFGLWLVALQCCILRAVSGVTVRGAWVAGTVLGAVFVVIPWATQRFY